jgi:PPOX class probable F420-dependent enzyme
VPDAPVPDAVSEFLARPNPAVMATVRPDGWPHTAATWYDWAEGRVLLNLDASRVRLGYLRQDPRVALTVMEEGAWYHHVSLIGEVDSIEPDPDLRDIDRLSERYTGSPYARRDQTRWSAWMRVQRWHGWQRGARWPGGGS